MVFQLYKYSTHYYVIFGFSSPKNRDIFKSKNDKYDQKWGKAVGQCLKNCCCCVVKNEFQAFAAFVLNSVTASIVLL